MTVSKTMRAASPPASAAELIEATGGRRNRNRLGRMAKQNSLDEMGLDLEDEAEEFNDDDSGVESGFGRDSPRPQALCFDVTDIRFSLRILALKFMH